MEIVLLAEEVQPSKRKQVFKGLFGEDLVMIDDDWDKPTESATTKLTKREYEALEGWASKFNMSKARFMRDCIKQRMKDLRMLCE